MKFSFELTQEDWIEFNKRYLSQSKQAKNWKMNGIVSFPIAALLVVLYKYVTDGDLSFMSLIVTLIVIAFLTAIWGFVYDKWYVNHTIKALKREIESGDNSSMLGVHEYELTDEYMVVKEPASETKMKWDGIVKIDETDKYLFLYNSAVTAFVIPKFKITENGDRIFEMIRGKVSSKD